MSSDTIEVVRLCELLPERRRAELADFARFLLEREGDDRWEAIIAAPDPRPKLDAFLRESAADPAEPVDADRP